MYWIRKVRGCPLSLAYLSKTFDRDELMAEIDRAYRDGDLIPGVSRCIVISREFANADISVPDLILIQEQVKRIEKSAGGQRVPSFVSVFVAGPGHEAIALEVYMTLWSIEKTVSPQFHTTFSLDAAEAVLKRVMPLPDPLGTLFSRTLPTQICPHALQSRDVSQASQVER